MTITISSLYIISAASGTGKTTLIRDVLKQTSQLSVSISHTTRSPRSCECCGRDYHFVTPGEFNRKVVQGDFLEHATVHDNSYGTSRSEVERLFHQNQDVILEIDWQGAAQIRQSGLKTVSIFVLPPSLNELRQRILTRQQDSLQTIERRLQAASEEISHCAEYDYIIVNDDFAMASFELQSIILAERCKTGVQMKRHEALLNELVV